MCNNMILCAYDNLITLNDFIQKKNVYVYCVATQIGLNQLSATVERKAKHITLQFTMCELRCRWSLLCILAGCVVHAAHTNPLSMHPTVDNILVGFFK